MSRRKLRKSREKWKNKKEDQSKIISCVVEESVGAKSEEFSSEPSVCERKPQKHTCAKSTGRKEKSSKQVHFSVLPDKYEPLEEDRVSDTATREKQKKYKRFRKVCSLLLKFGCTILLFK